MLGHGAGIGYTGPSPRMGPNDNFSLVTGSARTLLTLDEVLPNGLLWFAKASTRDAVTLTRCPDALLYSSWYLIVDTPPPPPSSSTAPTVPKSAAELPELGLSAIT